MDQLLIELVDSVRKLSPEVWEIAMRQVTVEIAQNIFSLVIILVFFIICFKSFRAGMIEYGAKDWGDFFGATWHTMLVVPIAFFSLMLSVLISNTLSMWVNPEFHAIEILLEMLVK